MVLLYGFTMGWYSFTMGLYGFTMENMILVWDKYGFTIG